MAPTGRGALQLCGPLSLSPLTDCAQGQGEHPWSRISPSHIARAPLSSSLHFLCALSAHEALCRGAASSVSSVSEARPLDSRDPLTVTKS